jgi:7-carboxy-7-deazaguanine synthase
MKSLQVHEIFSSINGEICRPHQGSMCTFLRLQGCNLRCVYCDTKKAQRNEVNVKQTMTVANIVKEVKKQKNINVTITGGEPMLQLESLDILVRKLITTNNVSIETNGAVKIPLGFPWVVVNWVIDYKLPYSGECTKMVEENFHNLSHHDIVKFVVGSYSDFVFAVRKAEEIKKLCTKNIADFPIFAFSPCIGNMEPMELYEYMGKLDFLKDTGAVFSLQLHKIIGVS